jgi:hypothetical protein
LYLGLPIVGGSESVSLGKPLSGQLCKKHGQEQGKEQGKEQGWGRPLKKQRFSNILLLDSALGVVGAAPPAPAAVERLADVS